VAAVVRPERTPSYGAQVSAQPSVRQQRAFLHVGAPKTGTTFLQTLLWEYRHALRHQHGVLFPGERYDEHFFAAVDLQDRTFHGDPRPDAAGAWDAVAAQARAWPGTTVISHEVFATATPEQARRAVADLAPAEVHVVYTVRDLGRQVPSQWQEAVKHGATDTFEQWWAAVARRDPHHQFARWFWPMEELPDVVARWGDLVGSGRFHLVTVPRGGGREVLWERFCGVIGLDPAAVDPEAAAVTNTGLGVAEVEVVRRLNAALDNALPPVVYQHVVKGVLAHETLPEHPGSPRLTLPADRVPVVEETSRRWLQALQERGVRVVGDLADLLPVAPPADAPHPDSATDAEVAETAIWALKQVLLRLEDERVAHATERARWERSLTGRLRRALRPRTRVREWRAARAA
jgi:hypothetical protein